MWSIPSLRFGEMALVFIASIPVGEKVKWSKLELTMMQLLFLLLRQNVDIIWVILRIWQVVFVV